MLLFDLEREMTPLSRSEKFELIRYLLDLIAADEQSSRQHAPQVSLWQTTRGKTEETALDHSRPPISEAWHTMLASEDILRRDWERPEEDLAWAHL